MDVERCDAVFGWRPRTALAEGLAETVRWYREHARE